MPELRPEGFYRVRLDGEPGVAYCQHLGPFSIAPDEYESWTVLYLGVRFGDKAHPATATVTPRSDKRRRLEVLEPL